MDADRNVIPIVEDDQGEGMMDVFSCQEFLEHQNAVFGHIAKQLKTPVKSVNKKAERIRFGRMIRGNR